MYWQRKHFIPVLNWRFCWSVSCPEIRKAGFKNLSVDLMYGLPGQTLAGWKQTVANVIKLQPEHISCYGLKLEEGTPLYEQQDQYDLPDDDLQADMYLAAVDLLAEKGFRQ